MIDALEVQVPWEIPLNRRFWANRKSRPTARGSAYQVVWHHEVVIKVEGEDRPKRKKSVLDALLHTGDPRRCDANGHKLEFKRVRHLCADDFPWLLQQYFEISASQVGDLKLMRVDFAVDTSVPVNWFRNNAEVRFKQTGSQYEGRRVEQKRAVQTLVFGKTPDVYRIYDKILERLGSGEDLLYPGLGNGAPPPIVTRLERECRGVGIPSSVRTLANLLDRAVEIDPFERLVLHTGAGLHEVPGMTAAMWLGCLGLRAAIESEGGVVAVKKRLHQLSKGNSKRIFERYSKFLSPEYGISKAGLLQLYRRQTLRQLYPAKFLGRPNEGNGLIL